MSTSLAVRLMVTGVATAVAAISDLATGGILFPSLKAKPAVSNWLVVMVLIPYRRRRVRYRRC